MLKLLPLRSVSLCLLVAALSACGGNTTASTPSCDPACPAHTTCLAGVCQPVDTGCASDTDCAPGVCDAATKTCVPSDCSPACPAYETCAGRACELSPGRCNSASDCPASAPLCQSNSCTAPAVTPPSAQRYAALIVTNQAYAAQFQQIALMHTLTGTPTQVVTVEAICAATSGGCSATDACHDAPKAIKDYLIAQAAQGLKLVVLGGDNSIVPSRMTHSDYSNPLYPPAFDEDFYSDDYFGDLSNWDGNGNCVYGEEGDGTDAPGYLPTLGVSRISVSSAAELSAYFAKEQAYLTRYDVTRINTALFMSNIATYLDVPFVGETPIDSALYFEAPGRTLSFIPDGFDVTKLYSNIGGTWPGSSPLTDAAELSAFEAGANLVVHSGHGDESDITVEQDGSNEFSGADAYALQNTQLPVLVSCACEAATFADGDGCAGQNFITAPNGGGIGYLGNSTIGLGIAGGMQLLDQFVKFSFATSNPLIGDAIRAAHVNMPTSDSLSITVLGVTASYSVIDPTSWRWTQKAATYLGDGLLPIYTDVTTSAAPAIAAAKSTLGDFTALTFTPAAGAVGTLAVSLGANIYDLPLDGTGDPVTLTVQQPVTQVTFGFSSATTLSVFQTVSLP